MADSRRLHSIDFVIDLSGMADYARGRTNFTTDGEVHRGETKDNILSAISGKGRAKADILEMLTS